jgi:hypothetical protein
MKTHARRSSSSLFGGLSIERIAELHALSSRTIDRDWRFARAFLQRALSP